MIITYLGSQFFKVSHGDTVLAFNPISKDSKGDTKPSRFGCDIAFSTTNNPDYNGFEMVTHGDTVPFQIDGPGDYEVKNIFIKGIQTTVTLDKKKYINTIYTLTLDNISLCFLGCVNASSVDSNVRGQIESPDIVFVPVGNEELLSCSEAYKLAVSLEAKIIIPMSYDEKSLKTFLKEGGQEKIEQIDKLTIKSKDLMGSEGQIVVLKS